MTGKGDLQRCYRIMRFFFIRLWDAVGGFLFLFANMQEKLSKHSSQVDLLKELLNLQKDMVVMMLSMLEGIYGYSRMSRDDMN